MSIHILKTSALCRHFRSKQNVFCLLLYSMSKHVKSVPQQLFPQCSYYRRFGVGIHGRSNHSHPSKFSKVTCRPYPRFKQPASCIISICFVLSSHWTVTNLSPFLNFCLSTIDLKAVSQSSRHSPERRDTVGSFKNNVEMFQRSRI